jgi:hypothetical protein
VLAETGEMSPTDTWTALSVELSVPATSDGLKLELVRTGCTSVACPTSGAILFDDVSLMKEQ